MAPSRNCQGASCLLPSKGPVNVLAEQYCWLGLCLVASIREAAFLLVGHQGVGAANSWCPLINLSHPIISRAPPAVLM